MHEQQTDATNEIMEPGGPGSQLAQAEALFRPPLHEVHVSHPLSQAASECQMDEDQTDETATDFTDLSLDISRCTFKIIQISFLSCNTNDATCIRTAQACAQALLRNAAEPKRGRETESLRPASHCVAGLFET